MRVLVIDDEPMIRSVVVAALYGNAEVVEAADGPSALGVLAEEQVDLVLLDVMMPGMSGYEVLTRLRGDGVHTHIPVIMLTARAGETDFVTAYRAGADAYLTKPFDVVGLIHLIDEVVRRGPAGRAARREEELRRAELLRQIEHQFGPS